MLFSLFAGYQDVKVLHLEPAEAMRPLPPLLAKIWLNPSRNLNMLTVQGMMAARNLSRTKDEVSLSISAFFFVCYFWIYLVYE